MTTLEIIMWIVIIVVVLSFIIDPNGGVPSYLKKLFGIKTTVVTPYEACFNKGEGSSCKTIDIPDGLCINGACILRNSPAYDLDHAKLLFRTTLKANLARCKADANTCGEVATTIENILAYVDENDNAKTVIEMERSNDGTYTDFRLRRVQGALASLFKQSIVASFRYTGSTCYRTATGSPDSEREGFIGKGTTGVGLFLPKQGFLDKNNLYDFITVSRGTSSSESICFIYNSEDLIPWYG